MKFLDTLPKPLVLINELVVRKHYTLVKPRFQQFELLINTIINSPSNEIVPVYKFEITSADPEYTSYFYDMRRLYPLESEEKLIINCCDINLLQPWENEIPLILLGKEKYPNLINFLTKVINDLKYKDLHAGNIMKDENGSYRLIDIEGFIY